MAFKDDFQKVLHGESASLYEAFVQLSKKALPPDADVRYQYLRSPIGKFIARDDADVDVYTVRVAQKHIPKFKWLYDGLFREYSNVFCKDLDLVVWGCGCGLDLLAFYDRALEQKNPQLWVKVRHVTLVDASAAALARAKQIAEMLFPLAKVSDVQCDLSKPAEIKRKVVLRQLTAYLPRIHLISNLLDLFDNVRPFAEAVKMCAARNLWSNHKLELKQYQYFNELVVAFSPDYQKGIVALKVADFRRTWNSSFSTDVQTVGNGPGNCEFCAFSCCTLAGLQSRCYRAYMRGKNHVLNALVAKCSTVEPGFDFDKFVSALADQKVLGMNFLCAYRWVEVSRYKGKEIDRFIFVPYPNQNPSLAPCVVEWIPVGDNQVTKVKKSAEYAIRDLKTLRGDECVTIDGKKEDFVVLCWDGEMLTCRDRESGEVLSFDEGDSDGESTTKKYEANEKEKFWVCDSVVDYSLYFRIDPGDAEPLPDLERNMDKEQQEVIYSRAQYRKIRGGAGCGKSTTMMWHGVLSVLRTHLPVLLVCKTVTLFSRNARRMAATLLQQIPGLEYVDSDLIRFMTLDKVLCEHVQDRERLCLLRKCMQCKGNCRHGLAMDCGDFQSVGKNWRKLDEAEKNACCNVCVGSNIRRLARKGSTFADGSTAYGAVMIDEVQSVNPTLVQAVVNLTYGGNSARECYVFCDERQCLNPEAVEIDPEKGKLRVKVPDRGAGYGRWVDLNKPYRMAMDFTGRLSDVAVKLQLLTAEKYGSVELVKFVNGGQMELSSAEVFSVRRSTGLLLRDVLAEISALRMLGADSITVVCDSVDDVRGLLGCQDASGWRSTHLPRKSHVEEQKLRMSFRETPGEVQLTTVTLAQGWDFANVIYVCTSDMLGGNRNVLENVLTGATRATSFMRILDRSPSGWLYETLKELD